MVRIVLTTPIAICVLLVLATAGCQREANTLPQLEARVLHNPASVPDLLALGGAYMAAEMYHSAFVQYAHAREIDPTSFDALSGLARAHEALGNSEASLKVVNEALHQRPDDIQALNLRARLLLAHDRPAEAAQSLARVVELDPGNADALTQLPIAYMRAGQPAEAEAVARQAAEQLPDHVDALLSLGVVLAARKQVPEAEATLRRAMAAAPDDGRPPARLAELLLREQRNLEEVVELARHAGTLDPANGVPAAIAAMALRDLGRPEDAMEELREAALRFPRNTRLWWLLAAIAHQAGDEETAGRAASMAVRFAPRRTLGSSTDFGDMTDEQ